MALLPLAAAALGGTATRWSQAVVLIGIGAVLLLAPPRTSAGRGLNCVLLGLAAWTAMGFLPAAWFARPAWRAALEEDFGLTPPGTLSPQPWLTAEAGVLFLAGASWFYLMWTAGWNPAQKWRLGRFYAAGMVVLAAVMALLYTAKVTVPFWVNERHFGPFPSRNQTADFLALGALLVLACAHGRWRSGKRAAAIGWVLGLLTMAWAVFLSFSRAGVAILFLGVLIYLGAELRRAARRAANQPVGAPPLLSAKLRRLALAGTAMLGLLSAFLLFGGSTLDRFRPASASAPVTAITTEFRLRIQADALDLVRASPWCGVGLGNFSGVFPAYRHRSALPERAIHPESDYLWVAAELGWPAAALLLAGGTLIFRRLRPNASGPDRRLRLAATLAFAAFALHGFIDVPGHRLGTAMSALFLMSLALPTEPAGAAAARRSRWVFRALGLGFVGCGVFWLLNAFDVLPPSPGQQGIDRLKAQANRQSAQRDYAAADRSIAQAAAWGPLDWTLHFARGVTRLQSRQGVEDALSEFRLARYLEPFSADVPLNESRAWLESGQDALAIHALAEACRREPDHAEGFIGDIFRAAGPRADFREQLSVLTRGDPALDLPFLEQLVPPESAQRIAERVAADPDLTRLNDSQKAWFFRIWAQRGDVRALAQAMAQRPDWQKLGWRWQAEALARSGDEKSACAVAARFAAAPVLPPQPKTLPAPGELLSAVAVSPDSPLPALQLYFARGDGISAGAVLSAVRRVAAKPDCPRYFYYLDAQLSGEAGEWPRAWEAWRRYLQAP